MELQYKMTGFLLIPDLVMKHLALRTIQNVNHTDSGSYTICVTTTAGSGTTVVNLDVYCELQLDLLHKYIKACSSSTKFVRTSQTCYTYVRT